MGIKLTVRQEGDAPGASPLIEKLFDDAIIVIGNDPAATLPLNGSVAAAEQVVIIDETIHHVLINRAEGTALNGRMLPLGARRLLREGDDLKIGNYTVRIALRDEPGVGPSHAGDSHEGPGAFEQLVPGGPEQLFAPAETESPARAPEIVPGESSAPEPAADSAPPPAKSFAAILDSLRTDEDKFYFLIEGGKQSGTRFPIEGQEIPIGLDGTGEEICFEADRIADPRAVLRKDWSGAIVYATGAAQVSVNDEPVGDMRRLRDGDRLTFDAAGERGRTGGKPVLIFHEPASLIVLDSLIPRTTLPAAGLAGAASPLAPPANAASAAPQPRPHDKLLALLKGNEEYFGAFTLLELLLMAASTLVGAVIIFLILNYS